MTTTSDTTTPPASPSPAAPQDAPSPAHQSSSPPTDAKSHFDNMTPRIAVFGIGGAGGNAVNNMIRSDLKGVEFYVCNTDAQALKQSMATTRIQLGPNLTKGLGAGSKPDIGRASAEEILSEIDTYFNGINMVFVTAGMGGGTGTGAAPVIAQAARDKGILTVGVVTKPFHFEGSHRMHTADRGIELMQKHVDTLIIIPNQNLFRVANERTTFADAFRMADEVLHAGVRGVTDLMIMPGLINLDFADVRTVMSEMGKAMMGTGDAQGDNRAIEAAEAAISNPLLDDVSMRGARGVLISITGGEDLTLYEVDEAANRIREEVDADANIIFGSTFNPELNGKLRVSVVATGIDAQHDRTLVSVASPLVPTSENAEMTQSSLDFQDDDDQALFDATDEAHGLFGDTDADLDVDDDQDGAPTPLNDDPFAQGDQDDADAEDGDEDYGIPPRRSPLHAHDPYKTDNAKDRQGPPSGHSKFGTDEPPRKPSFLERLGFGRKKGPSLAPQDRMTPVEKESAKRNRPRAAADTFGANSGASKPADGHAGGLSPKGAPQGPASRRKAVKQPLEQKTPSFEPSEEPQVDDMYDIPAYLRKRK